MPPTRAPLPVEVVTKIPVNLGGLGLSDPGVTGTISRVGAQAASVEVVTQVPGGLKNITPTSLGQKLAAASKIGVQAGSKLVGLGVGVLGNLAQDLLFPEPVGLGSDMVGGVKIGAQATTTRPIAKPTATAPRPVTRTPAPAPRPVARTPTAAPTIPKPKPITQPKIQTQPLAPTTTQPRSAPTQTRPQPISLTTPPPRAALQTPLPPSRSTPITESPFPLNTVDLNSYGGVNLTYPIAQKLIEFDHRFNEIERQLQEAPQTFQEFLKTAKIETTVTLPAKSEIIAQLPMKTDLTSQLPLNLDIKSQLPIKTDLTSQLPIKTDLTSQLPLNIAIDSQLPVNFDLRKEVPLIVDLRKEIPVNIGLISQIPLGFNLTKEIPLSVDLRKEIPLNIGLNSLLPVSLGFNSLLPLNLGLGSQIPFNIDLSKQLPLSVDLSAILRPDNEASGLNSLQKCCEDIQTTLLKKKEEMIEGMGNLICDNATIPYSYRGAGLTGIHQLIKIVLSANQQILEKICVLKTEGSQPLIQGSGSYGCGTLASTYNYSGLGLLGIQNQIDQLFKLDKKILTEVCEIGSSPFGSLPFPDITGQIQYFDCDAQTQTLIYSGNGLQGLSRQIDALATVVKVGVEASCKSSGPVVIMPDARYEEFKPTAQLEITLGTKYPSQGGSLWHMYIPNPIDTFNWCQHFENISVTKGNIYARLEWANSKIPTAAYFESEEEAERVLRYLATLSTTKPTLNEFGQPKVLIQKGNSSKRNIPVRTLRAVRAAASTFGADGEVASVKCYTPPPEGCRPTII
jgi:hypothetical protein